MLQELYNQQKNRQQNGSPQLKWEAFTLALENTKLVLEDAEASQARVDAAQNAMQHALDALERQAAPALKNPGFEEGETGWGMPDWRSIVTDAGKVHSGTNALYVTGRWAEYIGPEQDVTALLNAAGPGAMIWLLGDVWQRDSTAQVVLALNGAEFHLL